MTVLYPDIKTKNWQLSTVGVGYIAEGLADIRQCIDILLRTQKGSDPLRPQFGCDIYQYVDKPVNFAIPNIVRAIIEAVEIWETRVKLKSVRYEISTDNPGQVKFYVTCRLANEELIDLILLYYGGGFVINTDPIDTGSLTLYALFPPNPNGKRYILYFEGDGHDIAPNPPPSGFATIGDLFAWVQSAYTGYGTWQLGVDRITLFVTPGIIQTGALTMELVGSAIFEAPVPTLEVGQNYQLTFLPDGVPAVPPTPPTFSTVGAMLAWVQSNWGAYGTWEIRTNNYGEGDFDISDFDSEDFDVGAPAEYLLVLTSDSVNTCTLQVNPV